MTSRIFYRAGYKYQLSADYRTLVPINPQASIKTDWIELSPGGVSGWT